MRERSGLDLDKFKKDMDGEQSRDESKPIASAASHLG
jgi:hypothetical protein